MRASDRKKKPGGGKFVLEMVPAAAWGGSGGLVPPAPVPWSMKTMQAVASMQVVAAKHP